MIAISLILIFGGCYLAYKNPPLSITLVLAALPIYMVRFPLFNALDLLIFSVMAVYIITHFKEFKENILKYKKITKLLIGWLAVSIIALFIPWQELNGLGIWKSYFLIPIIFSMVCLSIIKTKKDIKKILVGLSILTAYVGLSALFQVLYPEGLNGFMAIPNPTWQNPDNLRTTGLLEYPNALGLLLSPLIPLIILLSFLTKSIWQGKLYLVIGILSFSAVFFAKSKGALIALGLSIIASSLFIYKKKAVIGWLLIMLLLLLFIPSINPLLNTIGPNSYSAQLRFIGWQETIQFLKTQPIFGAGINGYSEAVIPFHSHNYLEIFLYPHNIFLNFWVELGLLGLIYISFFFFYSLKQSWLKFKNPQTRPYILAGIISLIIIVIHGIVDVPYFKNDLAIVFLLILIWPFIITNVFAENDIS